MSVKTLDLSSHLPAKDPVYSVYDKEGHRLFNVKGAPGSAVIARLAERAPTLDDGHYTFHEKRDGVSRKVGHFEVKGTTPPAFQIENAVYDRLEEIRNMDKRPSKPRKRKAKPETTTHEEV